MVRVAALAGLTGAAVAVVVFGLLHVLDAGRVDPFRRTLSEYALGTHGALFDAGVLALVAGSVAVLVALVAAGLVRPVSGATAGVTVWAVGMALVVVFEKTNWAVGPSVGGVIHRYASLVAFLALPVGALLAVRGRPDARAVRVLAIGSLTWLGVILAGVLLRPLTGVPWWQLLPLGVTERGLAITEVATLVALAVWALRAPRAVGSGVLSAVSVR